MSETVGTDKAPGRSGKGRRRFQMLILAVLAVAVLWSAGWFALRHYVGGKLDGFEARAASEGAVLSCGDRSIGGFPFRVDVTCMPLAASCPAEAVSLDLAGLEAVGMAYNPGHAIFAAKGPLALKGPGGTSVDANWTSLQSSVRLGLSGFSRYSLVTDGFDATLADPGRLPGPVPVRAQHAEFHVLPDPDGADMLDVFLSLGQFTATLPGRPGLPPVDGEIAAAVPAVLLMEHGEPAERWVASGKPIRIDRFDVTIAGVAASIAGELTPAADGLLNGRLTVRLDQLERLPDLVEALRPGSGQRVKQMIGLVSALLRPVTVDGRAWREATVTIASGRATLGFIPLGTLPRVGPAPYVPPPEPPTLPPAAEPEATGPVASAEPPPPAAPAPPAAAAPAGEVASPPVSPPDLETLAPVSLAKRCAVTS